MEVFIPFALSQIPTLLRRYKIGVRDIGPVGLADSVRSS